MTERNLLKQLHNLKVSVKPASQRKARGRDILMNQISQGEPLSRVGFFSVVKNLPPFDFIGRVSQPAWAVILIILAILGAGTGSLYAARGTKPGDSLYIAKIISEKTRAAFTFSEKQKMKLSVEFAGNRAKEMVEVQKGGNGGQAERMEKLTNDFKKEIRNIKIAATKNSPAPAVKKENADDGERIFGANLGKDEKGMQITGGGADVASSSGSGAERESAASTTVEALPSGQEQELEKVLNEAEKLFAEENYGATVDKLEEANEMVK